MIPASRSIAPARSAAKPLPWVESLRPLYEQGLVLRHGQLVMVGGAPGSGKSMFTQWLCNNWDLPVCYASMDMSQTDTITRLGAMRCNMTHEEVKQAFEEDGPQSAWIEDELGQSLMDFIYDDAPALADLEQQLQAYVEAHDHYPQVFVVDNLLDIDHASEAGNEYSAWNEALLWFKSLVRETGMTVIVVHHARELDKTDYPAPRKDFAGKPSRTPEVVLSVSMTPSGIFRVAVVKNRTGPQSPMAKTGVEFSVNPAKMSFRPMGSWEAPAKRGEAA